MVTVLKTVLAARRAWVRIPPPPFTLSEVEGLTLSEVEGPIGYGARMVFLYGKVS